MRATHWTVLGWILTAGIAAGLYLRWSEVSNTLALAAVGLSPLLIVPTVALVVCAWKAARPSLRLAALASGVVYAATFASPSAVLGCGPESSDDQVVIFDHNVQYRAGRAPDIAAQVVAAGADVLVLQEVWPALMAELEADPALAEHRYRASEAVDDTTGLALWSRWPLRDATLGRLGGRPILRAEVDSPHGRFTVHAVHTSAPVGTALSAAWRTELAELATYGTATPTVLAGDFNATADHRQFRAVLDQGWTDVHRPKGCGFDATWPEGRAVPPVSLLRLDHVLVTEHFEVLATEIGPASGSDHRSVTATIRLAQGP